MPNYTYECRRCSHLTDHFCKYEDRPEDIKCETCGEVAIYTLIPPAIKRVSYLDGNNRFKDVKEAAKLNRIAADADEKTKKEIHKEIRTGLKVDIERGPT